MPEVTYTTVSWTAGDVLTEAKLDNMVANDRAVDAMNNGIELAERAAPSTPVANRLHVYAKDVSGYTELYGIDGDGKDHPLMTPAGVVTAYGGSAAPTGWLLCDGQAVSRTTYAKLFAAISTTYGAGDGSTTFNLPNLKGRVPVGLDAAQIEFDALAETGGAKTHTLTTAEMPAHTHGVPTKEGTGSNVGQGGNNAVATPSTDSAGGGSAHNNLQPYLVVNYIIKW